MSALSYNKDVKTEKKEMVLKERGKTQRVRNIKKKAKGNGNMSP
jgi:hypothetical protein